MQEEAAIEPALSIIDPHFHLLDQLPEGDTRAPYLLEDFANEIRRSGHNVEAGVFVECLIAYRDESAPPELRSLGEAEYIGEVASAAQGTARQDLLAGMIGKVDLRQGARVEELLALHMQASGGRLRGIRNSIAWDAYPPLSAMGLDPHLYQHDGFRQGMAVLGKAGLLFESWLFAHQIADFTRLARDFPGNTLILDHIGNPLGLGPYAVRMDEVFSQWNADMEELAKCPNVLVKVGGMGPFWEDEQGGQPTSGQLATRWQPWIERTVELFGPDRCMFESNYPANAGVSSYGRIWNAFKLVTRGWPEDTRTALFSGTARRVFSIG